MEINKSLKENKLRTPENDLENNYSLDEAKKGEESY